MPEFLVAPRGKGLNSWKNSYNNKIHNFATFAGSVLTNPKEKGPPHGGPLIVYHLIFRR